MLHSGVDVVILRPKHLEQVRVLAGRLGVKPSRAWLRTLRWAGRAMLATGADRTTAEGLIAAAREAGFATVVREGHAQGGLRSVIASRAGALGAIAFLAGTAAAAFRLFFVDSYNMSIHFLGLLWLQLVTRDPGTFRVVGLIGGVLASLAIGYAAMIVVLSTLAWARLSPALVVTQAAEARQPLILIPARPSFRWARLWPAAIGLVLVAGSWFAANRVFRPSREDGTASALVPLPEVRRMLAPLPDDPWKARAELEDRMRPRPDRRFVRAFEDLRLLAQGARPTCAAGWASGAWEIACDGMRVASLPEVPAFADALGALRVRANQLRPSRGGPVPAFAGLTDDEAIAALRDGGAHRDAGDAGARHAAASAYVALAAQALDRMEVADALFARALAALALDEDAHGAAEPQMEALLASAMGYERSARAAIAASPEDDPVRRFVLRQDEPLAKAAETGPRFLQLLWLRRLEDLHREREALQWRGRLANPASVSWLRDGLVHTQDVEAGSIRETLPYVKVALEHHLGWHWQETTWEKVRSLWRGHRSGPLLDAFEEELEEVGVRGGLFDRDAIGAYYRAALYTGISVATEQLVDGASRPEQARAFLQSLGTFPTSPARDLAIWMKAQLPFGTAHEYTAGKPGAEALAASLHLGPGALEQALRFANEDADASMRAERLVAERMDTRPEHRRLLATNALFHLHDVPLARWACKALFAEQVEDSPGAAACARTLRDKQMLLAIARSPANELSLRAMAVRFIADVGLAPAAEIDAEFEKLLALDDGWGRVVQQYAKLLEARGEYAHARRIIEGWLPARRGLSVNEVNVRTIRARMLYLEGNPQEAWRELEPMLQSGSYGVMMRASYVLSALGRKTEAEAMARRRLSELPRDWDSLTVLAELLWRHGKPDEAARLLERPPFRIDRDDWRTHVAPAFANALAQRPDAEALAAFASLENARVPRRNLRELVVGVADAAGGRLALAMLSRLLEKGSDDGILLARTASVVRSTDGDAAAAAWLRARMPVHRGQLARALYEQGEDRLLWDVFPFAVTDADVWLLRLAAALRTPQIRATGGELPPGVFAGSSGDETYMLARYLANLSGEESIRGATNRTQTAWALGTRAEAEGRRSDAVAWYQLAVAGGKPVEPERRFALDALSRWAGEAMTAPGRRTAAR